jgi:hypothetical protein
VSLSIICPTILGREQALAATMAGYREHTPVDAQVIVPQGHATVGEAWNTGARQADGDVLLFAIDDAVPHAGWYEAGMAVLAADTIPSPTLYFMDGTLETAGSMGLGGLMPLGTDGVRCRTGGLLLMQRRHWEWVGEFAPIHYYVDDDWCHRAEEYDIGLQVCHGYAFTHLHHPRGRDVVQQRAMADRDVFLRRAAGL